MAGTKDTTPLALVGGLLLRILCAYLTMLSAALGSEEKRGQPFMLQAAGKRKLEQLQAGESRAINELDVGCKNAKVSCIGICRFGLTEI
ncbi:hypothetical protein FB451DRAFT_1283816 [Mycena latifolia]|nr:hypothetical protein FB451DRAFT_1283816 [Mycena latifolia]